jgi:hypothetical protein
MNHPKCGQKECGVDATCSMVWPGTPRANFCRPHADKAIAVAMVLGVDVRSLDMRSVDGETFPYPSDLSLDDGMQGLVSVWVEKPPVTTRVDETTGLPEPACKCVHARNYQRSEDDKTIRQVCPTCGATTQSVPLASTSFGRKR